MFGSTNNSPEGGLRQPSEISSIRQRLIDQKLD